MSLTVNFTIFGNKFSLQLFNINNNYHIILFTDEGCCIDKVCMSEEESSFDVNLTEEYENGKISSYSTAYHGW